MGNRELTLTLPDGDPRAMAEMGQLVRDTGRPGAAHAARIALSGEGPHLVFTDIEPPAGVLTRPT